MSHPDELFVGGIVKYVVHGEIIEMKVHAYCDANGQTVDAITKYVKCTYFNELSKSFEKPIFHVSELFFDA